ncbi:hypothetical protein CSCA_4505 [Clostridium scatologenes]|uniref:Uncharacterized protein n=1 Tax=Clostridium scatologenes TaxID=1548 RepID=A0A0E3K417_CLOSL|nr:hypothetical protein CSCA_4505 [Clostridium scatologenes]
MNFIKLYYDRKSNNTLISKNISSILEIIRYYSKILES